MKHSRSYTSILHTGLAGITLIPAFFLPAVSFAANASTSLDTAHAVNVLGGGGPAPSGLGECFGHYTFGSTPVVLESPLAQAAAGSTFAFSGEVQNQNPYNVPNASVWVKVVRTRAIHDGNGPDVVDFFKIADGVNIPAHGSVPVSGSWQVPANAENGEYQLLTFVTESDRFNLSGLTFSDDVVGNSLSFAVVAGAEGAVAFEKDGATLSGEPYGFAVPTPSVGQTATPHRWWRAS